MKRHLNSFFLMASTFFPSFLRIWLLRALGHKVGRKVRISILTILDAPAIEIGDEVRIGPLNLIKCGGDVKIGFSSEISFLVIIYGRDYFRLGERSYVSIKTFIDTTGGVEIGSYSGTGPGTMIFSHAIFLPPTRGFPRVIKKTEIGDYVWLGAMNVVTGGSAVGNKLMSLPCSVLSKRVEGDVFFISKERQLPMSKVCKNLSEIDIRSLVFDILRDFAEVRRENFQAREDILRVGGQEFEVVSNCSEEVDKDKIYFIVSDKINSRMQGRWYNVVSLECSPLCRDSLDRELQVHMRKYFGLHFVYAKG